MLPSDLDLTLDVFKPLPFSKRFEGLHFFEHLVDIFDLGLLDSVFAEFFLDFFLYDLETLF